MHKRAAQLVLAAEEIRRQLWLSLPARVRLGEFFVRLASASTDAFGAAIYQQFALHGIEGTGITDPKRPARGVGREFGQKVYRVLLSKFHRIDLVEDVMSNFMLRFLTKGADHLKDENTLARAEAYVIRGAINEGLNALRKSKWEKSVNTRNDEDEDGSLYDTTPSSEDSKPKLDLERLPQSLKSKLKSIHPDAELYIHLSGVKGHTDREILGDLSNPADKNSPIIPSTSLLKHPYNSDGGALKEKTWNNIKSKIYKALKEFAGGDADALFEG